MVLAMAAGRAGPGGTWLRRAAVAVLGAGILLALIRIGAWLAGAG